ncbi:MAG: pyridoxal phosphate-dependent aminotransferase [Gammaproteobacteria bacterium]
MIAPLQKKTQPTISRHFKTRQPSSIRIASIRFAERQDGVEAIDVAIGNVSLPMHPSMTNRMENLGTVNSPFYGGVVQYTPTIGTDETRAAFLNVIESSGMSVENLYCQVTDGGSQAMTLIVLGCCGPAGTQEQPLMLIDPTYTNYLAFVERLGRSAVSIRRHLQENGKFTLPSITDIKQTIEETHPGALIIIPYDNPTGHFYDHDTMVALARLCVQYDIWMVSDEAYRELFYTDDPPTSIWAITEEEVPGITGRRISIESASKVWNACGLRIGALITDNINFHTQSVAENTASLCPSAISQYIVGALAHESHKNLQSWYKKQRQYYKTMLETFTQSMRKLLPGIIVSSPDAAIYSIVDVRKLVDEAFDAMDFVMYCAGEGYVEIDGKKITLLTASMGGFYSVHSGDENPGRTQMRIAYVVSPEEMTLVPFLFAALFKQYQSYRIGL